MKILEAESGTSIFVPKEAVISNGNSSPYVFLLKDEKVVTDGADRLSDGDKVNALGSDEE